MPRMRLLVDEIPTRQQVQCEALGPGFYTEPPLDITDDDDEPAYGADPFDIVAHREALGLDDEH